MSLIQLKWLLWSCNNIKHIKFKHIPFKHIGLYQGDYNVNEVCFKIKQ